MYKMDSRMTAIAGVHLGERVGVGTGVVCGICPPMYISVKPAFPAHSLAFLWQ